MSDKKKNKRNKVRDFLRYRRDEMTGEEKNAFERELQRDHFAEEAAEGFDLISPAEIKNDLTDLQKRIRSRSGRQNRFVVYRIAASVAILMIISSIFIVVERDRPVKQLSAIQAEPKILEIPLNKPIIKETPKNKVAEKLPLISEKKSVKPAVAKVAVAEEKASAKDEALNIAEPEKIPEFQNDNMKAAKPATKRALPQPVAIRVVGENTKETSLEGKVISADDNLPVAGATISVKGMKNIVVTDTGGNFSITLPDSLNHTFVANYIGMKSKEFEAKADSRVQVKLQPDITSLSEVVVTGYGENRSQDIYNGYIPPQPIIGKSGFNKYIRENIHRPDSTTTGQRIVVILSFVVHADGNLDSMKVIKSPGKLFSDEAFRLIKSGPEWKPALDNGKPVRDVVTIRIVFR